MANIAIFDSGIGGITFLAQARQCLPYHDFIYYADTDHVPYGTKTTPEVQRLVQQAVEFLCNHRIDILVLACNTATSAASQALRAAHAFPIVGMEPALKPALKAAHPKKVLLFSTSLTMREDKLRNLMTVLEAGHRVDTVALDELVQAAERFEFDSPLVRRVVEKALSNKLLSEYGAVVLGCTHFIYFKPLIRRLLPPTTHLIDGNQGTLNNLMRILETRQFNGVTDGGGLAFFSSGRPDSPERIAQLMALMYPPLASGSMDRERYA